MNIKQKERNRINKIISKYCGYNTPKGFSKMYDELLESGVEIGLITNRTENGAGSWSGTGYYKVNGETVENSLFVMSVYEPMNSERNDYNCYVS